MSLPGPLSIVRMGSEMLDLAFVGRGEVLIRYPALYCYSNAGVPLYTFQNPPLVASMPLPGYRIIHKRKVRGEMRLCMWSQLKTSPPCCRILKHFKIC